MWTLFFDMSSGGYEKTPHSVVIVQGDKSSAIDIFQQEFNIDPYNTTCDCCGPDFSISCYDTLEDAQQCYTPYDCKVIYQEKE